MLNLNAYRIWLTLLNVLSLLIICTSGEPCGDDIPSRCSCILDVMVCKNFTEFPQFTPPDRIKTLQFKESAFRTLPQIQLVKNSNVETLLLSACEIYHIEDKAFENMARIKFLDLTLNYITHLGEFALFGLKNLNNLVISRNKLKSISSEAFDATPNLAYLDIDSNPNIRLVGGVFANLQNLKYLSMSHCEFTDVPSEEIEHAPHLENLQLDGNLFSGLEKNSFNGLQHLTRLSMDGTGIADIKYGAFNDLESLQTLRLSHNKLQTVSTSTMDPIRATLQVIHLNNNDLTTLPYNFLIWDNMIEKKLEGNPWNCDCALHFMNTLNIQEQAKYELIRKGCHTPATYYGVSIRNATQTMSCDCVGEECVPHNGGSANVALAITLTVLFVLIAIAAVFGYRYYKRRQLLQKGTNIRYSSVYKDTVESNPHGPATLSSM